jgi:hypothetical protein
MLVLGTVMDFPLPVNGSNSTGDANDLPYTILFNNGTTASIPLLQMAGLIPPPPITPSTVNDSDALLPFFLQLNSRITYKHKGQYHKGYLSWQDGIYLFLFESHVNKRKEEWDLPFPNLPLTWVDLCVEGILIPGHVPHSLLWSLLSSMPTNFNPVTSFVSAVNLHWDCPPSLLKALADTHPDREVWLESFFEEKRSIQNLDTNKKITLCGYCMLREKGAPRAIPTMCILIIKKDQALCPLLCQVPHCCPWQS